MIHEFTAILEKVDSSLGWNYHFILPKEVSEVIIKGNRRLLCSINNVLEIQCGIFPKGKGVYFININKKTREELDVNNGDHLKIKLTEDKSKYGMTIPPVFEELLNQDIEDENYFHQLTPGKQRNLIYIVSKPKSEILQLEKAIIILNYLKSTKGIIDYKELNNALRKK